MSEEKPKTETCPSCGGTGTRLGILEYNPLDIWPCSKCGGSGYIPLKELSRKEKIIEAIRRDVNNVF